MRIWVCSWENHWRFEFTTICLILLSLFPSAVARPNSSWCFQEDRERDQNKSPTTTKQKNNTRIVNLKWSMIAHDRHRNWVTVCQSRETYSTGSTVCRAWISIRDKLKAYMLQKKVRGLMEGSTSVPPRFYQSGWTREIQVDWRDIDTVGWAEITQQTKSKYINIKYPTYTNETKSPPALTCSFLIFKRFSVLS